MVGLRFVRNGVDSILTCDEAANIRIWNRKYGVVEAGPFVMGDAKSLRQVTQNMTLTSMEISSKTVNLCQSLPALASGDSARAQLNQLMWKVVMCGAVEGFDWVRGPRESPFQPNPGSWWNSFGRNPQSRW